MPARRIPNTDKVIFTNPHTGDLVINMKDHPDVDASVRNEDITVIGRFTDYAGSGNRPAAEVMRAGLQDHAENPLDAAVGAEEVERTNRGKRASTQRQRPKLVYMEV